MQVPATASREKNREEMIETCEMYQQQLAGRVKAQDAALREMHMKQLEELEVLKKSQDENNKAYEKKQEEQDSLLSFLLRKHATQTKHRT
jgi:hypothetical protein